MSEFYKLGCVLRTESILDDFHGNYSVIGQTHHLPVHHSCTGQAALCMATTFPAGAEGFTALPSFDGASQPSY